MDQPPTSVRTVFDATGWIVRDDMRGVPPNTMARFVRYDDGGIAAYVGTVTLTGVAASDVASVDVHDHTTYERRRPTWAIVLAIIGAFVFLLGLLFLLVKDNVPIQSAMVTVHTTDGRVLAFAVKQPAGAVRPRFI
jgi:hypothetical protein